MTIYAVVYTESTYVEGDQRSRDYPGHGYPAHTVENKVFKAFDSEQQFKDWVTREKSSGYGKSFKAYRCEEISITTEIKINLS